MTSSSNREAFVWIWLPGETEPVVAGRLEADNGNVQFNYAKSYLGRIGGSKPAIPIYEPELPLKAGMLPLPDELTMPGCIRDASPDAWGRRVVINKMLGHKDVGADTGYLDELSYLLESGSNRIGAIDFQCSPTEYIPRVANKADNVSVEELMESAERVEKGISLSPDLDQALIHGSSIGGAQPKALIQVQDKQYVAKFPSSTDSHSIVKAEFVAMRLASLAGLNVAPVKLVKCANKKVLLIERFDRAPEGDGWSRKAMVSALTLLGLDEMMARYASYETLAEIIRHRFTDPKTTLRELFSRLVFHILCSNTDDHARNHAAFWDGSELTLTPAYDICPQNRTGNEASQGMLISGANRRSQLKSCLETAHNFLLPKAEARGIFEKLTAVIEQQWDAVCEEAELSGVDKRRLWERQFLNPYSMTID